jgi:putative ABC transport system permease protein
VKVYWHGTRGRRGGETASRFRRRRDGYTLRDVMSDAVRGLSGRPGRLVLTVVAVMLGIGSLVATLGFAQTGANQIQARFDAVAATQLSVAPAEDPMDPGRLLAVMPWDAADRMERLNGVVAAGLVARVEAVQTVTAVPVNDPMALPGRAPDVMAVSPGFLETVEGQVDQGVFINTFHESGAQRVAVLGPGAAETLGITRVDNQPAIFINGVSFTVIGIASGAIRHQEVLDAVMVPLPTARQWLGLATAGELQVKIEVGAGSLVAQQAPQILDPGGGEGFSVVAPPPVSRMREQLTGDVDSLFLILGLVALGIGTLVIGVVMSLSVLERRGEVGLRRALGATRRQIALQFVAECVVVGLLGGLIGAAAGVFGVLGISVAKAWTPVLDVRLVGLAAVAGVMVGVLAGLAPALRASRLEPATALQEGT